MLTALVLGSMAASLAIAQATPNTCQPREQEPLLPIFHIIGNVTGGAGPSRAKSASRSLQRALLTPQVNAGSRYRCSRST